MLENKEGTQAPEAEFTRIENGSLTKRKTGEIFAGRKVVLFSLPGAFTPTCSSSHVPGYEELHDCFKKEGVDEVICTSVNDAFVMSAWSADQKADHITFLADGNGEFTEKMGLLVDKSAIGFGKRSWRYSMFVQDGKIEKMFIEPEVPGDPFEVSDAYTMLGFLNPEAPALKKTLVFAKEGCAFCKKAKSLLKEHGYVFEELTIGKEITGAGFSAIFGESTVPRIFMDGKLIGGCEELEKLFS